MYKFSILIPTRKRIPELSRLIDSIKKKTDNLSKIEVIFGVDFDDRATLERVRLYNQLNKINYKVLLQNQTDNLSDNYYNAMAGMSKGEIIWVLNDDCEIKTQNWDKLILQKLKNYRTDIFYLDVNDTTRNFNNNGQFSCFPMISRKAFNIFGYFFHPQIRTWGADKWLHYVYNKANCIIPMLDIKVIHHREAKDQNYERMKRTFKEDNLSTITERVNFYEDIQKLIKGKDGSNYF